MKTFLRSICGVHLCDCIPLMKDLTAIACSAVLSPSRLLCTHASSRPEHCLCFPLTFRKFRNVRVPLCLTTNRFWYFSFAHKLVASIFVYLGEFRLSFKISCPQYIKSVYNLALHFWEMLWNDKKAWTMLWQFSEWQNAVLLTIFCQPCWRSRNTISRQSERFYFGRPQVSA